MVDFFKCDTKRVTLTHQGSEPCQLSSYKCRWCWRERHSLSDTGLAPQITCFQRQSIHHYSKVSLPLHIYCLSLYVSTHRVCVCEREGKRIIHAEPHEYEVYQPPSWGSKGKRSFQLYQELELCASTSLSGTRGSPVCSPSAAHIRPLDSAKICSCASNYNQRMERSRNSIPSFFCCRLQPHLKGMCWYADPFILSHFKFPPRNICGSIGLIIMIQTSTIHSESVDSVFLQFCIILIITFNCNYIKR